MLSVTLRENVQEWLGEIIYHSNLRLRPPIGRSEIQQGTGASFKL